MHQAASIGRWLAGQRGSSASMLTTISAAERPHSEFSTTWPRFDVVSTAYHEQSSASAMSGTIASDTFRTTSLRVARALSRSIHAHWVAKHNSARVATE